MTAHDGGYRVVIVDPADDMNVNAANALLKNLEEPPSRTLFMLIAPFARPPPADDPLALPDHAVPPARRRRLVGGGGTAPACPSPAATAAAVAERAAGSAREAILLTHYGGLEIAEALDALVGGERINLAKAHRLADAVGGRDQAIQFDIFNRYVQDVISRAAGEAARAGDRWRANRLAEVWQVDACDDRRRAHLQPRPQAARSGHRPRPACGLAGLGHDPKKWMPVFEKDHAQTRG